MRFHEPGVWTADPRRDRRTGARGFGAVVVSVLSIAGLTLAGGCAIRQNAPVVPEIEAAGMAPKGAEPTEFDVEGDDAAEVAP